MKRLTFRKRELALFWYWINERHRIYEARAAGKAYPWTKDKILHEYKFTNVFRELDRVTQEWKLRYQHLLAIKKRVPDDVLFFQLCLFRFFNWPETYDEIFYNTKVGAWNEKKAVELLRHRQESDHEQIFTGAYIITSGGRSQPKVEIICEALSYVWENRKDLLARCRHADTMQGTVEVLKEINTVGGFVAYELACDMRHSKLLPKPTDKDTWANPGPGAMRGIHRLLKGTHKWTGKKPDYIAAMRALLVMAYEGSGPGLHVLKNAQKLPFEMREIEHSLCEFDKYMRVKRGEGKPRSRYHYKEPMVMEAYDDE